MANRPITITGIQNGELVLSDNGNTFVNGVDTVTWKIGTGSGVASITGIVDDSTIDVFSPDPTQKQNSSSWEGTVREGIAAGTVETYHITYTTTSGDSGTHDPKISVNS